MSFMYPGALYGTEFISCLWFDNEKQEILIDEESLLRIIMMVNNYQKPRKIRLLSRERMEEYKKKN